MSCNIVMYKNLRMCASAYIRITPKPEVEIMMRNKKELKGFLLTATRLIVLALVFVTAFTVALTSDFAKIDFDGIAFAERTHKDQKGEVTFGKANPILPDQGAITAESFDFPNIASPWLFTATYYNVSPHATTNNDNDPQNNVEIYKNDGDTKLFLGNDTPGVFDGGVTNGYAGNDLNMVLNFETGSFINEILNSGKYTVTAEIKANFSMNSESEEMYPSAVAGPARLTGQKAYQLRKTVMEITHIVSTLSDRIRLDIRRRLNLLLPKSIFHWRLECIMLGKRRQENVI